MLSEVEGMSLDWDAYLNKPVFLPDFLRKTLDGKGEEELICVLGTGCGMELPFIRMFAGEKAEIFAFDKKRLTPYIERYSKETGVVFYEGDINDPMGIIDMMGKRIPTIVICRQPPIFIALGYYEGQINKPLVKGFVEWGRIIHENERQMLITVFSRYERQVLAKSMEQAGLKPKIGKNTLVPEEAVVRINGKIVAGEDVYWLKID
jgi:hypothetical protein